MTNMKSSLFLFILFYLVYLSKEFSSKNPNKIVSKLIEWGLENNLTLSSFLEISSEKDPKFIAKKSIEKNETLLIIPYNISFNVEKALKLISSKNLRSQLHRFKHEEFLYIEFEDEEFRKEEAFLAYILYLMQYRPKKYQKTKFYEEYQYYLESLQIPPKIKPFFLDNEGLEKLYMTYINVLYKSIKRNYEEEIFIFKGESYSKKEIDYEDYLPHRLNVHNKGIKIFERKTMVPFLNLFDTDYIYYNANYTIEKDGSVRIYAKKNIQKYQDIILYSKKKSNAQNFLFEGKTYEKLVNYFDEYLIPHFGISVYYRFDIIDKDLENQYFINLLDDDFDENAIEVYKDNIDILKDERKRDKNNVTYGYVYEILMNNIKSFNVYIKNFNREKIYEYFDEPEIRPHIERIIRGESKVLQNAYNYVRRKASKYVDLNSIQENEEEKKNTDL